MLPREARRRCEELEPVRCSSDVTKLVAAFACDTMRTNLMARRREYVWSGSRITSAVNNVRFGAYTLRFRTDDERVLQWRSPHFRTQIRLQWHRYFGWVSLYIPKLHITAKEGSSTIPHLSFGFWAEWTKKPRLPVPHNSLNVSFFGCKYTFRIRCWRSLHWYR